MPIMIRKMGLTHFMNELADNIPLPYIVPNRNTGKSFRFPGVLHDYLIGASNTLPVPR